MDTCTLSMTMKSENNPSKPHVLRRLFGDRLLEHVRMARYCSARVGGHADFVLISSSAAQLEQDVRMLWDQNIAFHMLGGASNVLISEAGIEGLVLLNHARDIQIHETQEPPTVWAESGAMMTQLVNLVGKAGLCGLEWAAGLPGTLGGALYGNAGAFGSEISHNLILAEILHESFGRTSWKPADFEYSYRSSVLKEKTGRQIIILSALLRLQAGNREEIEALMALLKSKRMVKQPPGACTGSMFKNPPGDFAGRLIEAAGLKGKKVGDVEISKKHGNFFINNGSGTANDFMALIRSARKAVAEKFGISLELEVELLGRWESSPDG